MKRIAALLVSSLLALVAGCTTASSVTPKPSEHGNSEATAPGPASSPHCGVERWAVKTGTDPAASQVNLSDVHDSTLAAMDAIPVPAGFGQDAPRLPPVEETVYRLSATLTGYKMEADSDYHLVLSDGQGHTMIAEIPAPACVGSGSPFLAGITKARGEFDARYAPGDFFQPANVAVTVTGVGFFDTIHGQTGVAPNGIELHPVQDIQFGSG